MRRPSEPVETCLPLTTSRPLPPALQNFCQRFTLSTLAVVPLRIRSSRSNTCSRPRIGILWQLSSARLTRYSSDLRYGPTVSQISSGVGQQMDVEALARQHLVLDRRHVVIEREAHGAGGRVQVTARDVEIARRQQVEQVAEDDRAGGVSDQMNLELAAPVASAAASASASSVQPRPASAAAAAFCFIWLQIGFAAGPRQHFDRAIEHFGRSLLDALEHVAEVAFRAAALSSARLRGWRTSVSVGPVRHVRNTG